MMIYRLRRVGGAKAVTIIKIVFLNIFSRRTENEKWNPPAFLPRPLLRAAQEPRQNGKSFFPRKIVFPFCRVHIEAPPQCPNTWRAEPQKEKCPFHFKKNPPPRKTKE